LSVKFKIIEDNKRFLERRIRRLLELKKVTKESLKIGVPSSKDMHTQKRDKDGNIIVDDNATVSILQVAAVNEFGSSDGRIPERSFLRSTISKNKDKYKELGVKITKKLVDNPSKSLYKNLLGKLGLIAVQDVQKTIVELSEPENAESTQLKKGRSLGKGKKVDNPLIDTGQLRQSITYIIDSKR